MSDAVQRLFDEVRRQLGVNFEERQLAVALRPRSLYDAEVARVARVAELMGDARLRLAVLAILAEFDLQVREAVAAYNEAAISFISNAHLAERADALGIERWMKEYTNFVGDPIIPTADDLSNAMEILIHYAFEVGGEEAALEFVRAHVVEPYRRTDIFPTPVPRPPSVYPKAIKTPDDEADEEDTLLDELQPFHRGKRLQVTDFPLPSDDGKTLYRAEVRFEGGGKVLGFAQDEDKAQARLAALQHAINQARP